MKRVQLTLCVMLAAVSLIFAQQPAANTPPAAPGQNPPAAPSQTPAPPKPAEGPAQTPSLQQRPAPAPAPAPSRALPQAKTQEEFKAYNEAAAVKDPAAMEAAANDFAGKFKDSELRNLLYQRAMTLYQNANNADKTLEMGRKVLSLDPNNPVALVTVATVLAERTRETDLDREERLKEAINDARKALVTVDTDLAIPPGTPQERVDAAKKVLNSMAFAAIGTAELSRNDYAAAETNLRKSVEVNNVQPDAITWLRLSVVLDHEKKYPEAMAAANKAVELSPAGSVPFNLAQQERDRLLKLTGTTEPAPASAPSKTTPQPPTTGQQPPPK